MKKLIVALMLLFMSMIVGCNDLEEINLNEMTEIPEKIIELNDYPVPESISKVFVSQLGYDNLSAKTVLFHGENLGSDFQVVDAESKEVVYNGSIEKGEGLISHGCFTELEREGSYYVQTDIIGQSYTFEIGSQIFQTTLQSICESYGEDSLDKKDILSFCDGIIIALIALDFYPEILGEEGDYFLLPTIRVQIEELMKLKEDSTLTLEDQIMVAGTLAKFYNIYQGYDIEFARLCLKQAENYWTQVKNDPDIERFSTYFLMAELYKATGYYSYHNKLKELYNSEELNTLETSKQKIFGDISYQTTRRRADLTICNEIMEERLKKVQLISDEHSDFWHREENEHMDQTMLEILEIVIVDHLFESKAYLTTLTNKIYYLMGCNAEAINYFDEEKIDLKLDDKATIILLLSGIMGRELLLSE